MCSGSEAGSYFRLIDFVHHSTLGLRVAKQKKMEWTALLAEQAEWDTRAREKAARAEDARHWAKGYRGTSPIRNADPPRITIRP